jgi:hypothetical protein
MFVSMAADAAVIHRSSDDGEHGKIVELTEARKRTAERAQVPRRAGSADAHFHRSSLHRRFGTPMPLQLARGWKIHVGSDAPSKGHDRLRTYDTAWLSPLVGRIELRAVRVMGFSDCSRSLTRLRRSGFSTSASTPTSAFQYFCTNGIELTKCALSGACGKAGRRIAY